MNTKNSVVVLAPHLQRESVAVLLSRWKSPAMMLGYTWAELSQYSVVLPPDVSEYYRQSNNLTVKVARRRLLTETAAIHVGGIDRLELILGGTCRTHWLTEYDTLRLEKVTTLKGEPFVTRR